MTLKEQAQELYMLCFPDDSEQFAKTFTENCFDDCRYILKDGKLISMLFLLDCEIVTEEKKVEAKYLYAAATHPSFRSKGFMKKLINQVKAEAQEPIITKPANEELFSFYRSLGFKDAFYFSEEIYEKQNNVDFSFEQTTAEDYKIIRERLLGNTPHVSLGKCADMELLSLVLLKGENTCCAVDLDAEIPTVKEILSDKNNAWDAVLQFIDKPRAVFRTARFDKPFAMLFSPEGTSLPSKMYMGLAMD